MSVLDLDDRQGHAQGRRRRRARGRHAAPRRQGRLRHVRAGQPGRRHRHPEAFGDRAHRHRTAAARHRVLARRQDRLRHLRERRRRHRVRRRQERRRRARSRSSRSPRRRSARGRWAPRCRPTASTSTSRTAAANRSRSSTSPRRKVARLIDGVGARPWGIAVSAGGKVYTANGPSNDVSIVDARHRQGGEADQGRRPPLGNRRQVARGARATAATTNRGGRCRRRRSCC